MRNDAVSLGFDKPIDKLQRAWHLRISVVTGGVALSTTAAGGFSVIQIGLRRPSDSSLNKISLIQRRLDGEVVWWALPEMGSESYQAVEV